MRTSSPREAFNSYGSGDVVNGTVRWRRFERLARLARRACDAAGTRVVMHGALVRR